MQHLHVDFLIQYTVWQSEAGHFSDIEDEIELQIKNGADMGVGLHSRKTAVKIVDHIAKGIRNELFTKIIEQNKKICHHR